MPAVSEVPALPHRFRPFGVRMATYVFGALLVLTVAVIWMAFPEEIQEQFTTFQKATVFAMGLGFGLVGHSLARCRIDADEEGLTVVNGYRSHRYTWSQVVSVSLRPGNPWAMLDLSDGTARSALGIQGSDGLRAQRQVAQLRALLETRAGAEPGA